MQGGGARRGAQRLPPRLVREAAPPEHGLPEGGLESAVPQHPGVAQDGRDDPPRQDGRHGRMPLAVEPQHRDTKERDAGRRDVHPRGIAVRLP